MISCIACSTSNIDTTYRSISDGTVCTRCYFKIIKKATKSVYKEIKKTI